MNIKRYLISLGTSFIFVFLISGFWNMIIMKNFYVSHNFYDGDEDVSIIALGYFVMCAIMNFIFLRFRGNLQTIKDQFIFGAAIGILWVFPLNIVFAGVENTPMSWFMICTPWQMVEEGLVAIFIGWVSKKVKG